MKMSGEMINRIKREVEERGLETEYEYIGVRVQEQEFREGRLEHVSHRWEDGEDTGEELDGVSVSRISSIGKNEYYGNHVGIVCGNRAEYGEDEGELVIQDAEVMVVIR